MVQMKCPACETKGGYQIWHCPECGDTRCTYSKCTGTMNKGLRASGNYHQVGCRVCKSKKVKRIN